MRADGMGGGGLPAPRPEQEGVDLRPAEGLVQDTVLVAAVRRCCRGHSMRPRGSQDHLSF